MNSQESHCPTGSYANDCRTVSALLRGVCDVANERPEQERTPLVDFGQQWSSTHRGPECGIGIKNAILDSEHQLTIVCNKIGGCCLKVYGTDDVGVSRTLNVPLRRLDTN